MTNDIFVDLWGDNLEIPSEKDNTKTIIKKISKPKEVVEDVNKKLKSKKTSLEDRLKIIYAEVDKVLGHYKDETLTIKNLDSFNSYITKAIENGIISIDTETDNSLDTISCKLMGPCIYTPGLNQAYIPINHIDNNTEERLPWQLTEEDCRNQFKRLIDKNVKIIMHNGKFDYKVIHTTCNIDLPIYWDTYVAARMLDENEESAGLKQQYIDKINSEQEKYDIESLFTKVQYAQVDPEVFALYAATDAKMTYQLYEWQLNKFKDPDLKNIYNLFLNMEMPIIPVIAKMELTGVNLDLPYCQRLGIKYHKLLNEADEQAREELSKYSDKIEAWKKSKEANSPTRSYFVDTHEYPVDRKKYPFEDEKGFYKLGKSIAEKLSDPINLDSPTQLAILLYDILKCPQVSVKMPRGTGVEELNALYDKTKLELCKLILNKRAISKLLNTFIDKIPNEDINPTDGKIHAEFFNVATDTHRFSCARPNLQQLPRDEKDVRVMFCATPKGEETILSDKYINLYNQDEIETNRGWVKAKDLTIGDILENNFIIKNIEINGTQIRLEVEKNA